MALSRHFSVGVVLACCIACTPVDPELEASLGSDLGRQPAGTVQAAIGGAGQPTTNARARTPGWNPNDRIPNTNPRVLTNNVYGPGKSSDIYGRVVHHNPGLRIEESSLGAGDYTDQYGRSVRCYGSGMGTFCR